MASSPSTFVFQLTLCDSQPAVWRKLKVPGRYRLDQLHKMMQVLFGWDDSHLHQFQFGETLYSDPETFDGEFDEEDERVSLTSALGRSRVFIYRYDFGDSWEVEARLIERLPDDEDAPSCLDGAFAGPPDDCGGTPGFERLKEALADPDDPEHDEMRTWAPRGYDPLAFSASALTRKMIRQFGRKTRGAKAPSGVTLSGFQLSKLNLVGAVLAALLERSPMTLEQVQGRLTELDFPLPAGLESLRRAVGKSQHIRYRLDGALELIPGEQLDRALRWMGYKASQSSPPAPVPPPPPAESELPRGPLTWAELEAAVPHGAFPSAFSLRRQLTAVLDAIGGDASIEEALRALGQLLPNMRQDLTASALSTLKGSEAVLVREGRLQLQPDSGEVERARVKFREWTGKYRQRELYRAAAREQSDVAMANYRERKVAERARAAKLTVGVLAGCWPPGRFALALISGRGEGPSFSSTRPRPLKR